MTAARAYSLLPGDIVRLPYDRVGGSRPVTIDRAAVTADGAEVLIDYRLLAPFDGCAGTTTLPADAELEQLGQSA